MTCALADGKSSELTNAVKLHVKMLSFSWDYEFRVLGGGSFHAILGIDFFRRTMMTVDVAAVTFILRLHKTVACFFSH